MVGFAEVGTIPMSLYTAGASTQGASGLLAGFDPLTILDSAEQESGEEIA